MPGAVRDLCNAAAKVLRKNGIFPAGSLKFIHFAYICKEYESTNQHL